MKINPCVRVYETAEGKPPRGSLIRRPAPAALPKPVVLPQSFEHLVDKGIDSAVALLARSVFRAVSHVVSLAPYYPTPNFSENKIIKIKEII